MPGPLKGLNVIECGIWIQGPYAASILGDLGANVIKIEELGKGDPLRGLLGFTMTNHAEKIAQSGRNYGFENVNRNKKSIAINLAKGRGREIVYRLVETADIFIQNFRLGVSERLRIDYGTLCQYNPKLIYAQGSGYGMKGPNSASPGYDIQIMGRAGWMYMTGGPEVPPLAAVPGIGDQMGGITIAVAILAALVAREREGIGQFIDISVLGSLIAAAGFSLNHALMYGVEYPRRSREKITNPLASYYRCRDDKWLQLAMAQSERFWPSFCLAMGIEGLEKDPRFSSLEARRQNCEELIAILDKIFATKTREEWMEHFKKGPELFYGPILTPSEVINDTQATENEYITNFEHPAYGPIKIVGFPYKFSKTQPSVRLPPPEYGQHTEEVLSELGYTENEIVELKEQEVIL